MPGTVAVGASSPSSSTAAVLSHEASLRCQVTALRDSDTPNPRLRLARLLSFSSGPRSGPGRVSSPVLRALRDAVQMQLAAHNGDDATLYDVALAALDSFVSVSIHAARSKTSILFDQLCRERDWNSLALFSASTVAEAAFRAVNVTGKQLTMIDIAPEYEGRAIAKRLASVTGLPVRYGLLGNCHRLMEGVDIVVIGADEVTMNGCILAAPGTGVVVQVAREIGIPVVVTTQAVKFSESMIVDWTYAGYDVIRPEEILIVVTEMELGSWGPGFGPWAAPEVLSNLASAGACKRMTC